MNNKKISSNHLTGLILDVMIDSNILAKEYLENATQIVMHEINNLKKNQSYHTMSSGELSEKIVDSLISHNLISNENRELAISISVEEIDVRKIAGDY